MCRGAHECAAPRFPRRARKRVQEFSKIPRCLAPLLLQAGAAGVHFEDQLASAKKCGHLGGKVLVPTKEFVAKLQAARLAADVCDVPTILVARTDALGAFLMTSDVDPYDKPFCTGEARAA